MGYGDNNCLSHGGSFTPQQIARMRCFIDRNLSTWNANPRTCQTAADCGAATDNKCTSQICNDKKICEQRTVHCNVTKPCTTNTCDPHTAVCHEAPVTCTGPPGMSCAIPGCDPTTSRCLTDFAACAAKGSFTNDCCEPTPTPFCNDTRIINCVCQRNLHCCSQTWDHSCIELVAHCSETRDCLAEKLDYIKNVDCVTAYPVPLHPKNGGALIFKAAEIDKEQFVCLGAKVTAYGGWWIVDGTDVHEVRISTNYPETAHDTSIYFFDGCNLTKCLGASLTSSGTYAVADLYLLPHHKYSIFVGSVHAGTVAVTFNTTAVKHLFSTGGMIAITVILGIFVILAIVLMVYLCSNPRRSYTRS